MRKQLAGATKSPLVYARGAHNTAGGPPPPCGATRMQMLDGPRSPLGHAVRMQLADGPRPPLGSARRSHRRRIAAGGPPPLCDPSPDLSPSVHRSPRWSAWQSSPDTAGGSPPPHGWAKLCSAGSPGSPPESARPISVVSLPIANVQDWVHKAVPRRWSQTSSWVRANLCSRTCLRAHCHAAWHDKRMPCLCARAS